MFENFKDMFKGLGEHEKEEGVEETEFPFEIGDTVQVERTDGAVENDWEFVMVNQEGEVVVRKKEEGGENFLTKTIKMEAFRKLNK